MDEYLALVKEYGLRISQPYVGRGQTQGDISIYCTDGGYQTLTIDTENKLITKYNKNSAPLQFSKIKLTAQNLRNAIETLRN